MKKLSGRVAVVTGAGSGIGRALCGELHAAGCHIAAVDIDGEALAETARRLERVSTHRVDVSDRAQMAALPQEVLSAHGAVHVLINNAGVTVAARFLEHSLDDWDWLLGVNLQGVLHGCHFFLPHLLRADAAHIVNVSSLFGIIGVGGQTAYCTSKYAVRGLSESLGAELADTNVGLTVVHPGGVDTAIIDSARVAEQELRERVSARFKALGIPPQEAARQIIRAIRRDRRRLVITPEAALLDHLKRLLPVLGDVIANRALSGALGLRDEKVGPGSPADG